ncbi:MAG: extracellular solute-binding protein [Leptolyngbyaceae cyanobacterium MO_188.B28]|nr:extracellular solute-binding protein [Leptolyngbyaceae cyanobacterium MO_188.B28]
MAAHRHFFTSMLMSVLLLTGCAPSQPSSSGSPDQTILTPEQQALLSGEDLDALTAAAEAEGKVVVYSFTSRIAKIEAAFEAAYPKIDVVGFDISSTEQIARLKSEQAAGAQEVDVAYLSDAPVVFGELVETGILQKYTPPQFSERVPGKFQSPLLANRLSTKVLMYNEAAYPDGAPISNLWELTEPDWKGRVLMVNPLVRGDYLDLLVQVVLQSDAMAEAYQAYFGQPIQLDNGVNSAGEQWIADLFNNGLVLVSDTDAVNAAVGEIGQDNPPLGFTSYSDRRDNAEEGWALQLANDVQPVSGIYFPAMLGVVNNAPHPAAARLLIHFMMGDDSPEGGAGFAPFYVPGDYATRRDIAPHPDAVPLDGLNAWYVDAAKTAALRQDVADLVLTLQ